MSERHSTKEKGKKLAQNFLYKLADSFDLKKPETLPKPPSKPSQSNDFGATPSDENITSALNSLTISGAQKYDTVSPATPFVGGFNPIVQGNFYTANPTTHSNSVSAPNLPMPMAIPTTSLGYPQSLTPGYPQSLTMQMALRPEQDIPPINRIHSDPVPSSATSSGDTAFLTPGPSRLSNNRPPASSSAPSKPTKSQDSWNTALSTPGPSRLSSNRPSASPSTPNKPTKSQASSVVSSPSQKVGQVQCSGVTKAGKRCNRTVKIKPSAATVLLEDEDDEGSIPLFCFQHTKELLGPSGYYARKNGTWVKFEEWIPSYLQSETQVSLRVEMEKARTQSDVYGYIYTFEIREPDETETIKLKVGRAVNLVKRIDQWSKQCGSKEQILRGFFPGIVEPDEDGNTGSLMKGRVKSGEKGPWCHRLERLVHLELGDLVCSSIYLDPAWPEIDVSAKNVGGSDNAAVPCPDCGSMHKEIFEFQRWKQGENQGKEWEKLVKPVVERWGRFVALYV